MSHEKSLLKHDFIPHFEELRKRLFFCLITCSVAAIASYFYAEQILYYLIEPLKRHQDAQLFFHKPYEAFLIHVQVALLSGFIFSSPIILYQVWHFVAPGLYAREKKIAYPVILISIVLFLIGAAFSYFVVVPWGLHFFLSFATEDLKPLIGIGPYFSFLTGMILAFGVLFDFPVFIIGLVAMRLVTVKTLASLRKTFIIAIVVAAAVLTPSPDPVSQLLLAAPLWGLFEISLLVARVIERRHS